MNNPNDPSDKQESSNKQERGSQGRILPNLDTLKVFFAEQKKRDLSSPYSYITGDDAGYMLRTLRLQKGAAIIVRFFPSSFYLAKIVEITSKGPAESHGKLRDSRSRSLPKAKGSGYRVKVFFEREVKSTELSCFSIKRQTPEIRLFLAHPQPHVLSDIVRKTSELGLHFLQLVLSERSFFRKAARVNMQRYRRIAEETARNMKGMKPLLLPDPIDLYSLQQSPCFQEHIARQNRKSYLLWESESPAQHMKTLNEITRKDIESIAFFVGPEGGFSYKEKDFLVTLGFKSVSLHATVLRVETAVLFALAKLLA